MRDKDRIHRGARRAALTQGRGVNYARYRDEKQNAASIQDQHQICRRYIDQHGCALGACYEDAAISGASAHLRPGFQRLIADAQAGRFDVVVVEAIDRLGRRLSDVAALFDQFAFWGIQIHATDQITQMHVGMG